MDVQEVDGNQWQRRGRPKEVGMKGEEPKQGVPRGRGAATRRRLTNIAREMMAEGGEQTISLVEVAERAGVTRGKVYSHCRCSTELHRPASDSLERTDRKGVG